MHKTKLYAYHNKMHQNNHNINSKFNWMETRRNEKKMQDASLELQHHRCCNSEQSQN